MSAVALITGGSGAIGKALCLEAASRGFDVVFTYNTAFEDAAALEAEIDALGRRCLPAQCDLAEPDAVDSLTRLAADFGDLHLLINNAGVTSSRTLEELDLESWNRTIALNLTAPAWLSKRLAPDLRRTNGSIINIGSVGGVIGSVHSLAYGATKAGLLGLTKTLARMLAPDVRVNCICPGPIDTDMLDSLSEQQLDEIQNATALSRVGTVDEVAKVVLDVAAWTYCNGQTLIIDGGKVM